MAELIASGFGEFDRLGLLYRRTLELLDEVSATGALPAGGAQVLADETLAHVEDMEAGFRVWLRASEVDLAELRAMIARAGLLLPADPRNAAESRAALIERMQALSGAGGEREITRPPARQLSALELARIVFALLPATPSDEVHYPLGRRSYADIAAPRGPAELVERIEELEGRLWHVASGRPLRLSDGRYRRTYGFFDTAARLVGRGFLLS
jgi:hypothetical protein